MQEWIQEIFGSAVNPIAAYIIIFLVIVLAIYILVRIARRLLGGTFVAGGKSRHLRLAIMDATPVDSQRRLVLVRRDDVEHLILIGGATDIVIEQNIKLAAQPAQRQEPVPITPPAPITPPLPMAAPTPITPLVPTLSAQRGEAPNMPKPVQPVAQAPAVRQYTPTPIAPRPIQPIAPAPLRSTEPMAPRFEPRPIEPRPADVRPVATQSVTVERVVTPTAPRVDPPIAAATTVATVAAATVPQAATKSLSLEDSLLVDLSNDIDNAANEVDDISLEDEMEGLLASLDTKSDRIG
jgi:flagellar biogenesis protein FliO